MFAEVKHFIVEQEASLSMMAVTVNIKYEGKLHLKFYC